MDRKSKAREEIMSHAEELAGHRVKVIVLDEGQASSPDRDAAVRTAERQGRAGEFLSRPVAPDGYFGKRKRSHGTQASKRDPVCMPRRWLP